MSGITWRPPRAGGECELKGEEPAFRPAGSSTSRAIGMAFRSRTWSGPTEPTMRQVMLGSRGGGSYGWAKRRAPGIRSEGSSKGLREPRRVATAVGGRKPFKRSPGSVRRPRPGRQTKEPGAPHHAGTPGDARANAPRSLSAVGRGHQGSQAFTVALCDGQGLAMHSDRPGSPLEPVGRLLTD
jgi:hypothetical protein